MSPGLYSFADEPLRVAAQDAEIYYYATPKLKPDPLQMLDALVRGTQWRSERIVVWGKRHPQPRLTAWYGDEGKVYTYSGIRMTPLPWTELLLGLKGPVERLAAAEFNSVLLNYYRDQNDSMGFHSDNEPELGPRPTIASLSFGEVRTFVMKHRFLKNLPPLKMRLDSGSLLVMKGDTQRNWIHGVPKERGSCGARVNLTFRLIT